MSIRLTLALEPGGVTLPGSGKIAVFRPTGAADLSALPVDRVTVIQGFRPDHEHWAGRGYNCIGGLEAGDQQLEFSAAVVFLPRAKAEARALIAEAMAVTRGPVIVDGAKTDGIDSVMKDMRKRSALSGPISKAHGKLFWLDADPDLFADWAAQPGQVGQFVTAPGVFSADGIDPASQLLADALPEKLGRTVADLGAGWGYLAARCLERTGIETLHLVEAEQAALICARQNVTDPRARFHWADATTWSAPKPVDTVVMNPPFHTGRSAEPALGRAFIAAAARNLATGGTLWMVANRHLPYETALTAAFRNVEAVAGDNRFKIIRADRPLARSTKSR